MTYLRGPVSPRRIAAIVLAAAAVGVPACRTTPSTGSGIDLAGIDKTVAPGDDFNAYTNGGWIKATAIPADKASYGTDSILADKTRERLLALIQESAKAGSAAD